MKTIVCTGVLVCGVVLVGCSEPSTRLNAPPQGYSDYPHPMQEPYLAMTGNASAADMSVADVHFVPHTAELNSLGQMRLEHYAKLLKLYGGTLRYDYRVDDGRLVRQRVSSIRHFLATNGVEEESVQVTPGLPGAYGMDAEEAVVVYKASRGGQQDGRSSGTQLGGTLGGYGGQQ
ncbi:MAG TPA: hypothetical protein VMZ31_04130 [Phycisphaerae bacterium]|nr:hypothetical protein [Phycisphaerae bacterium]